MNHYASVIVDKKALSLDRTFQYRIPAELAGRIRAGSNVLVPFGAGNRMTAGYVVEVTDKADWDPAKIKDIAALNESGLDVRDQLFSLAGWIREEYGGSMIGAIHTVMPVRETVKPKKKKSLALALSEKQLEETLALCRKKKHAARIRLLEALSADPVIPWEVAINRLNLTGAVLSAAEKAGWIEIAEERQFRASLSPRQKKEADVRLNEEQRTALARFLETKAEGGTFLLHGITGSGKTEVYMEMIDSVLSEGKQAIVLIPEIALTYQTVMRFYRRFGDRVAFVNSRMSKGERFDQFCRAEAGEASIMIGPRSALFAPFPNLGVIIIDEEHENAYKSESVPKYHAADVARMRAVLAGAPLVLGSATPTVSDYYAAENGEFRLLNLTKRASAGSELPSVEIVDLREELRAGNRSIFSRTLTEQIRSALDRNEQIMLFLNRRGYSGFLSCRSCGKAVKCPHCDVSMTAHRNGKIVCHFCGYEQPIPRVCPSCGSRYLAGFGTGTEKVEAMLAEAFPDARILRMDADTTAQKGSYESILEAFSAHEADILLGTQMIVKGHDFAGVSVVGILAADMSLLGEDYRSAFRTFALLTQAAGRAGRRELAGHVVIQTYDPEHFAVKTSADQDYASFYREELTYRRMLEYPPFCSMLTMEGLSEDEELLNREMSRLAAGLSIAAASAGVKVKILGPNENSVRKLKDTFHSRLYIKCSDRRSLWELKQYAEKRMTGESRFQLQFDWNED